MVANMYSHATYHKSTSDKLFIGVNVDDLK